MNPEAPAEMLLVYVTCASADEAEAIAQHLLESRLVACATVGAEVRSRYWWRGEIESAREVQLLLKTQRARFAEVEHVVRRLHSYEIPEIIAVQVVAGSAPYLAWVAGESGVGKEPRT